MSIKLALGCQLCV